jgi:copper resistance protein B
MTRATRIAAACMLALPAAAGGQEHRHPAQQDSHASHAEHGRDAPREPIPPLTAADRAAAFPAIHAGHAMHGAGWHAYYQLDQLEARDSAEGTGLGWDAMAWVGGDLHRAWLRTEGERVDGRSEAADVELLYGRAVSRWWDLVAGARHDFGADGSQSFAALGVMGISPYKFEIQATAYVGESGRTHASLEAEYELLITNRLILQPRAELALFGEDDERRGIGAGLTSVEAGLRLRYEVTRRFAPYVGVLHEQALSKTADLRRAAGGDTRDTRLVAGVRTWF